MHVVLQAVAILAVVAAAMFTLPSPIAAQTARTAPLTFFRGLGPGGAQIGVEIRDISEADATAAKLTAPAGAFVQEVHPDSPAARAGVRTGDVIVTFDGERVRSAAHFARLVDETPEGRSVQTVVQRAGERVTLNVAPGAANTARTVTFGGAPALKLDDDFLRLRSRVTAHPPLAIWGAPARLGVTVQELTGQLGEYFGASSGVLVTAVTDSSPARTAGLRAGDVITRVNGETVAHAVDLRQRLGKTTGEVTLTIVRDRKEQTVTVAPPAAKAAPQPAIVK
jgi:serine protease Do